MADPELEETEYYEPQDAIGKATQGVLVCGSAGFLFSAVQNTMARQNYGALGVLTRFGGTTALFGMDVLNTISICMGLTGHSDRGRCIRLCQCSFGKPKRKEGSLE